MSKRNKKYSVREEINLMTPEPRYILVDGTLWINAFNSVIQWKKGFEKPEKELILPVNVTSR